MLWESGSDTSKGDQTWLKKIIPKPHVGLRGRAVGCSGQNRASGCG
jgi:hypothetical protein